MRYRERIGVWGRAVVTALVLVCLASIVPAAHADQKDVVVRVFRVEFAKVAEISAAIQPMLSDEGSVMVQPAKGRLTVRDRAGVMAAITEVVERLDQKPSPFRLHVELLGGSTVPISVAGGQEVGKRLKQMFPFKYYRELGSADLGGVTGDEISVELNDGFRISVTVLDHRLEPTAFGIPNQSLRLDLHPLVLEKVGTKGTQEVLRTRVVLSRNQEVVIGAGENEDSKEGLVLIVKALPVG
ncbi:MAG: hypothetical protein DRJ65_04735 [Acidobacteria bacterium]|nr:MAG: hypothetical protein DRJ65_04735 [Acidobacteriota bacterium]